MITPLDAAMTLLQIGDHRRGRVSSDVDWAVESGAVPPQTPETTNKTNNRTFAATHSVAALLENRTAVARLGSVTRLPTRGEL